MLPLLHPASQRSAIYTLRITSKALSSLLQNISRPVPPPALSSVVRPIFNPQRSSNFATMAKHAQASSLQNFMNTSGARDSVWIHQEPYSNRPHFGKLDKDIETDVCIVGSGIVGVSSAYELIKRGKKVVLIEARELISGETGRTSGHLSNSLDDSYVEIAKKHGQEGAQIAADSHTWAIKRIGEIAKELDIDCEYRLIPDYEISAHHKGSKEHDNDIEELKADADKASELGIPTEYRDNYAIKGWDGKVDQRDAVVFKDNATFHPTKYLVGMLKWLKQQPGFECFTHTRMASIDEKGLLRTTHVEVNTMDGHTIKCHDAIEATCIPLQKLSIVAEVEYFRTYCIAVRIPKGSVEDCLINDQDDPYHYIRFTACDEKDDYLVIGGGDHKVGQDVEGPQFQQLEKWVRERFTYAGSVDYKWSGQTLYSTSLVGMIGLNQGKSHTYVATGDTGHGLTHGVIAGRLFADSITGVDNAWASLYSPNKFPPISQLPAMIMHDLQINAQYKRFFETDIEDIGQLQRGEGGVLNAKTKKPLAVYKDEDGNVAKYSAICPHLKGVVCWNPAEKSWDCPIHGSRFSKEGLCVMGPSKGNLNPESEVAEQRQQAEEQGKIA